MTVKQKVYAILGPLSLFLYLSLCFFGTKFNFVGGDIWWKGLAIFLLIPLVPIIMGYKKISVTIIIMVLYLVIGFVSSSFGTPLWHPAWVIFLLIPVIQVLIQPSRKDPKRSFTYTYKDED